MFHIVLGLFLIIALQGTRPGWDEQ